VVPLSEDLTGDIRPTLLLLLATVALVWLIACANVTNLMLARFSRRAEEFATRLALGASRWHMIRQALAESTCLAGAGALVGVVLATWGTRAALGLLPSALPDIVTVELNWRVLLVAASAALMSGLVCGIVPAVRATRSDVSEGLRYSQRTMACHATGTQRAFLVGQLALAVTLMAGTGLLTRSLVRLWSVDPGFEPRGAVTFMSGLPRERAGSPEQVRTAIRQIAERLAAVPQVQAVSGVFGALPFTGNNNAVDFWRADSPRPAGSDAPLALFSAVGPDYFRAMGIAVRRGRGFAEHDTSLSPRVATIDDAFAASVFLGEDPLGQRLRLDSVDEPVEVVGVVGAVKHWGLDGRMAGHGARVQVYVPMAQLPDGLAPLAATAFSVVVRTPTASAEMLGTLRSALRELDGGHVMVNGTGLEDSIARSLADRRFSLVLLGTFALLGLALAVVGVYGLASYLGTGRTRELGVRIALGAQRTDIAVALLARMGKVVVAGIVVGLLASVGVTRLIASSLFGVSPTDPLTLGAVAGLLALVALMASSVPVRRAWRVDPVVALRHE
jgi:putative ABC transport system permease protein